MTQTDQHGLALSTTSPAAVAAFDDTIDAYLRFGRDTGPKLKAALKADPEMVMANCLLGHFMILMGTPVLLPRAAKALANADVCYSVATPRERLHLEALRAWIAGDLIAAVGFWEAILVEYPHDILAIKLAHFIHFYLGDSENLRDSIARVLPTWNETSKNYGFLLAMRAFGLEETGDYAAAENYGRKAVELNPDDTWGVHAVAHVFEMQDRHQEGLDWLNTLESSWRECNNFRYHVAWHRTLFLVDLSRYDEVLARYDQELWDPDSDEYLDLCNDASLLLRLEIAGIDVGERWQALFDKVKTRTHEHLLAFVDVHFAMILAAAGGSRAAKPLLDSLRAYHPEAPNTTGDILAREGLPICEALVAYRNSDYARTVDLLYPIRYQIRRIGGSHAQRDIFAQVLLDAAIKAGRFQLARALLAERTALKPNNPWSRRRYSEVLQLCH